MVAALVGEPYRLSMDQIANLTDFQIEQIYFHERDSEGRLVRPNNRTTEATNKASALASFLAAMGVDHAEIQRQLKALENAQENVDATVGDGQSADPLLAKERRRQRRSRKPSATINGQ